MKTKDVILELRTKNGLSQDALADKVSVLGTVSPVSQRDTA